MDIQRAISDIRHLAKEARPNHGQHGFDEPKAIADALSRIADALEELAQRHGAEK